MLRKSLISIVLLIIALASNGAGLAAAATTLGRQDLRPVPSVPAAEATTAVGEPGEELREEFHQTYPLSLTGRVSLENINGGVQIDAGIARSCR